MIGSLDTLIDANWLADAIALALVVCGGAAIAGAVLALCRAAGRDFPPPIVCDDDGTGTCPCELGDDIHRDGSPVAIADEEIDRMIRNYREGGNR